MYCSSVMVKSQSPGKGLRISASATSIWYVVPSTEAFWTGMVVLT